MNLRLLYPHDLEGFSFANLKAIPNKHNHESGYFLIAMIASQMSGPIASTTLDRYVCFTNQRLDEVWIEKLGILRSKKWFVFEDTRKIDNDEEWNSIYSFLKERKILE
jgi:hypothetical protein